MRSKENREQERSDARRASMKANASAPNPRKSSRFGVYLFSAVMFALSFAAAAFLLAAAFGLSVPALAAAILFGMAAAYSVRIAPHWERVVILRMGRFERDVYKRQGMSRPKAFAMGALSGLAEPLFGCLVVLGVGFITPYMPWMLAFSAGAMMFVVVEELIPEAHLGEHANWGTAGVMLGFLTMMILDVALG